ncbi:hypothetical protein P4O66_016145 [Electrophorus voltai]|uniref:Reverse transcriptase/retrotransposon-derived protein RNase H-like domain-containing protein n=1 Tax=Electrophorus voltai TaxID=2609070 RepID=A0AAD8YUJ4_9TELE|nr:hypothetical protein P4O66_016145 [Electrophorus voltai]
MLEQLRGARRFIKSFRTLAQPLTDLLQEQIKRLNWNPEVVKSFEELKTAFATGPVLQQPDPRRPFVVEVDALDVGVGAVLSPQKEKEGKLYTIAYFPRKLTERNYGVGFPRKPDREELWGRKLLAMKLAFEE